MKYLPSFLHLISYIIYVLQKSDEQAARMKEQTGHLSSEMATLREELEAKLQQEFQEAIKQLSEVIKLLVR